MGFWETAGELARKGADKIKEDMERQREAYDRMYSRASNWDVERLKKEYMVRKNSGSTYAEAEAKALREHLEQKGVRVLK